MRDKDLYATILGIQSPWKVIDVDLRAKEEEVIVRLEHDRSEELRCPECRRACPGYDTRRRRWRHLDTCQFRTIVEAEVPRVDCPDHQVRQIVVPWAEPGSAFTALMEALIIDWAQETANVSAVSRRMGLTWDEIDGVVQRAVKRGLDRRKLEAIERIGVDETAFQKRHEYVTVVSDLERARVLYVADDRGQASLDGFFQGLSPEERAGIVAIAMDMWAPYIRSALEHVEGASSKICFDRFHVAKQLNDAVDRVRKDEHKRLREEGDTLLKRTKYLWLQNPEDMTEDRRGLFELLRECNLEVGRAWSIKETARGLWNYVSRGWAAKAWNRWISWARRCRLEPMKRAAAMVKKHLWGILNAIVLHVTNAVGESLNAKIQRIKKNACGFRNRDRFRNAILFHLGGLDLYPATLSTHTDS